MALRFCDSFSHYTSATLGNGKWTSYSGGISATGGRRGNGSATNPTLQKFLDNQGTWIVGAAFSLSGSGSSSTPLLALFDTATTQCDVRPAGSGSVAITRNGTVLATSATGLYAATTYFFLELKVIIGTGTSGSAYCYLNGSLVCSATAVNTAGAGTTTANTVQLACAGSACDFYACDGTGSANNDHLGDVAVKCLLPTSSGNYSQWTPNASTNVSRVQDTTPDDDTTYNATSTTNAIDTYHCTTLAAGTVIGVQINTRIRVDDAGTHTGANLIRQSTTDYADTAATLSGTYTDLRNVHETDPATGIAWTVTGVNNAEFGYKFVS